MDRFKFRIWDKEDKEFLDKFSVNLSVNGILILWRLEGKKYIDLNDNNRYIPEQSTGLKDKHGNLLYENDIVYDNYSDDYGIIEFDEDEAKFGIRFDNVFYDFSNAFDLELYGNIHENPELLEATND